MRNLTIKRTKSFVGTIVKVKVYIEDPAANELTINKVPCRKLGTLKNGEEKTFQIGEQGAKVFVIGDRLSKSYCNDMYQLSDGQKDVVLTGKNTFSLLTGHPFRFDDNESPEALENRKKSKRRGCVVMGLALLLGMVLGFISAFYEAPAEPKTFSAQGMSITLTDAFEEFDGEEFTVAYGSEDFVVLGLKEEFSLQEGFADYTLEEYGNLVLENNGMEDFTLDSFEGLTYFEYVSTDPETNDDYYYFSCVYKASDAFWLIHFAALDADADAYLDQMVAAAKSVEFDP